MKLRLCRALTIGAIAATIISAPAQAAETAPKPAVPAVEAVFVVDTTGSMGGLIEAAKQKIWSIASTLGSARQTPSVKIGLLAYRDRGDAYVTKQVQLSSNLDQVYEELMKFQADGGGDGPESVNQALHESLTKFGWSNDSSTYRVVFLVGDAPPHMDYQDDVRYQDSVRLATTKRIVINTIQCGNDGSAEAPWREIARLAEGEYARVDQNGGAIVASTPFDDRLAALSAELESPRLYFGSEHDKAEGKIQEKRSKDIAAAAPAAAVAQRAAFNATAAGKSNFASTNELIGALQDGSVALDSLKKDDLPDELKTMKPEQQRAEIGKLTAKRKQIQEEIQQLSDKRQGFLKEQAAAVDPKATLDAIFTLQLRSRPHLPV